MRGQYQSIVCGCFVVLCLCVWAGRANAALEYHARGDLYAYAHNANSGVPIIRDIPASAATSVADTATQVGPSGNVATSSYYANLHTGMIGTYIYGYGPHADEYGGGGASLEAMASMDDRIHITIRPGTYEDDLYVALHGHIDGTISAAGIDGDRESNGYQVWNFALSGPLGGDGTYSVRTPNIYASDPVYSINQGFTLTARIMYADTIATPREVSLSVSASLKSKGAALATYPYGDQVTSVLCDFYNTGRFTALDLPDGCTFTTASGGSLPEPATAIPLALAVLGIRARRGKPQR